MYLTSNTLCFEPNVSHVQELGTSDLKSWRTPRRHQPYLQHCGPDEEAHRLTCTLTLVMRLISHECPKTKLFLCLDRGQLLTWLLLLLYLAPTRVLALSFGQTAALRSVPRRWAYRSL